METTPFATKPSTQRAVAVAPLLASIAREVKERSDALAQLLAKRGRIPLSLHAQRSALDAECSAHRASLRRIHKELEHLQCRLVGTNPHVFQVDATNEGEDDVLFWANE